MTDKANTDQFELFTEANGEQAAQRAPQKRRSKPPVHSAEQMSCRDPKPQSGPERDAITVVRFPVSVWGPGLWRHKVERSAQILIDRKTVKGRENYWRNAVDTLARKLERYGATPEETQQQIDAFHHAVSEALYFKSKDAK